MPCHLSLKLSAQCIESDCLQMSPAAARPVLEYITHAARDVGQMTMRVHSICLADATVLDSQAVSTTGQAGSD